MKFSDFNSWNKNQKLVALGFVLTVISIFLPWAKVSFMGMSVTARAADSFEFYFPVIILIYPLLTAITDVRNIHRYSGIGCAAFSFLYIASKINELGGNTDLGGIGRMFGLEVSIGIGLVLYFVGVIILGVGHFLLNKNNNDTTITQITH